MEFVYQERAGTHPYVQAFWRGEVLGGPYMVPADGCWDIIRTTTNGQTRLHISGMANRAHLVNLPPGTTLAGVRFKPGVYLQGLPAAQTINKGIELATTTSRHVWLNGINFSLPTYDNLESFVAKLIKCGLLAHDEVVWQALVSKTPGVAERSIQRHFAHSVGLPQVLIRRVRRAETAARLISSGLPPTQAADQAGYADQAHLTRELKYLLGNTPKQLSLAQTARTPG